MSGGSSGGWSAVVDSTGGREQGRQEKVVFIGCFLYAVTVLRLYVVELIFILTL